MLFLVYLLLLLFIILCIRYMFTEMQPYFLQNFHKLYETINKDELNDDEIAQF